MNSPIINVMKQNGFNVNEKGMCRGIALMALQAYLLGSNEFKRYSERFDRIMMGVENSNPHEESNKQEWVDIQAFLQSVSIFQQPYSYPGLFSSNTLLTQFNVEEIATVVQSDLAEKRGGIRKVYSFSGLYNSDDEVYKYLQSYKEAIMAVAHGRESHCALLLQCYNHTIMLVYDDIYSVWYLQSHDDRYVHKEADLTLLIQQIREAYRISFSPGELLLSTTVFSLADTLSESRKVCKLWCDNSDWKHIHEVSKRKAEKSNYGGWLYIAAVSRHLEIVKTLLKKGADINAATNEGATSLWVAAQDGHLEVVNTLLENGAAINAATKQGFTPLGVAALYGRLEVVNTLLEKGADASRVFTMKVEALHSLIASYTGRKIEFIVLEKKLSKNNNNEISNFSTLDAALLLHPEIVMTLINAGTQIKQEHTILLVREWFVADSKQLKECLENLVNKYEKIKFHADRYGYSSFFNREQNDATSPNEQKAFFLGCRIT